MLIPDDPLLRVGDRIRIVCPEAPSVCVERSVGPDGTVDVPSIGALPAAIRRVSALASDVASRLPGGLLPPQVEVRKVGGTAGEIVVEGAVAKPLRVFAPRGIVPDRLLNAAKLLPEADRTLIPITRRFAPGTVVTVPTVAIERRISVLGAVPNPRTLPPAENLLLGSAIESAGGLGVHADPNAIIVVRGGEPIPVQLPLDAGFHLWPGDIVRVGLLAERKYILVRGLVARPGSIEYAPGMTARAALSAAGGLLPTAKAGVLIWQTGSKSYRLSITFLLSGRIPDPVIGAQDTLVVEGGKP